MNVKSLAFACCPGFLRPLIERIEKSHLGRRMARGVFWSLAGAVISRGLMLGASVVLARMLGKDIFGEWGMVRSTVDMFGIFAGFSLGLTATKYVAEFCRSDPQRVGRVIAISNLCALVTGGIVATGLWMSSHWLAIHVVNSPHLSGVLRIGAFMLLINALNGAQNGALVGFEAFEAISLVNLAVGLASFPLLVGGAYFGGLEGIAWGLAIALALNWLLNHIALVRQAARFHVSVTFRDCTREWSVLWRFSLPASISGAMVGPVFWACNAFLVNQPDGYGEMGIFNAANNWRMAILFIPGVVTGVVLPMLSSLNDYRDRKRYLTVLKVNAFIAGGTAFILAVPIALASRWIMRGFGPGFEEGFWVLACLATSTVLVAVNNVVGQAIASKGRMWVGFGFNALWALTLLVASRILVHRGYGALGLALALLIAYVFHTIWQGVYLAYILRARETEGALRDLGFMEASQDAPARGDAADASPGTLGA